MVRIEQSWGEQLAGEFAQGYFARLCEFVREEYRTNVCYPPGSQIFRAFDLCPFDKVRVVILGQDPYHEPGQAEGLCFSVPQGITPPPSLRNIFKELAVPDANNGSLVPWAQQGVLLLNATLTVRAHVAGSHQRQGWEQFTDAVIKLISERKEHVVFMLWGGYARSKKSLIDSTKHLILEAVHPSPLSANRGGWFGNGHFDKCNQYLSANGCEPIKWR